LWNSVANLSHIKIKIFPFVHLINSGRVSKMYLSTFHFGSIVYHNMSVI
jgi:hypothetical protein